jgi:hypothetical protein
MCSNERALSSVNARIILTYLPQLQPTHVNTKLLCFSPFLGAILAFSDPWSCPSKKNDCGYGPYTIFLDKNVSVFGENSDYPMMQGSDGRIPKGVYLWGTVGGGKTMLMDMFYDTLEGKLFCF